MASPEAVVLEADTGEGGLSICRWQRIDCVIFELDLPDMSGFRLLINLVPRSRRPKMPVIVLTRRALYPMGELALKNGAQAYLVKNQISRDMLYEVMQEAVDRIPHKDCSFGEFH
jgi:DNA-binding NarL/FixJ family response regulator